MHVTINVSVTEIGSNHEGFKTVVLTALSDPPGGRLAVHWEPTSVLIVNN